MGHCLHLVHLAVSPLWDMPLVLASGGKLLSGTVVRTARNREVNGKNRIKESVYVRVQIRGRHE